MAVSKRIPNIMKDLSSFQRIESNLFRYLESDYMISFAAPCDGRINIYASPTPQLLGQYDNAGTEKITVSAYKTDTEIGAEIMRRLVPKIEIMQREAMIEIQERARSADRMKEVKKEISDLIQPIRVSDSGKTCVMTGRIQNNDAMVIIKSEGSAQIVIDDLSYDNAIRFIETLRAAPKKPCGVEDPIH